MLKCSFQGALGSRKVDEYLCVCISSSCTGSPRDLNEHKNVISKITFVRSKISTTRIL